MRAFICGLKGLALEAEERAFLSDAAPWGVILFRRNVELREQVARLTADIREALGRTRAGAGRSGGRPRAAPRAAALARLSGRRPFRTGRRRRRAGASGSPGSGRG